MTQTFPTFTQLYSIMLQNIEGKINQESPLNDKAYNRMMAYNQAIIGTLMQKEVQQAIKENFALTASRDTLINLFGVEYETPIKEETYTVLNITLPATTGTIIPSLTNFTGVDNGVLYYDAASRTSVASSVSLEVTARPPNGGTIGNLAVAQKMQMAVNIAGAEQTATIASVKTLGAEAEDTEVYRQRILDIIRAPGGGGNFADYRNWAKKKEGVVQAYPYSASPPPTRKVYIEAQESLFTDGIPDSTFLAAVKEIIITDPDTEQYREPATLTNYLLSVLPITRTEFFVMIDNATFATGTESQVKADILTAVDAYFKGLNPFIQGVDIDADRNDKITGTSVSEVVSVVLRANSASADGVTFGLIPGTPVSNYQLDNGEKAKNGGVSYV